MSKIQAILYDADGVLIQSEVASIELERRYGIQRSVSREFFEKEWAEILVGKADTREKIAPYLKKWGWPGSVEDYQKFWFEFEHKLNEELLEHVTQLRQNGIKCFVATNQDAYRAAYMLEHMGFKNSFDGLFASAHLGEKKPSREFFEKVLAAIEHSPDEVLFWDDDATNIAAAEDMGIYTEIYTDFGDYRSRMKKTYKL